MNKRGTGLAFPDSIVGTIFKLEAAASDAGVFGGRVALSAARILESFAANVCNFAQTQLRCFG